MKLKISEQQSAQLKENILRGIGYYEKADVRPMPFKRAAEISKKVATDYYSELLTPVLLKTLNRLEQQQNYFKLLPNAYKDRNSRKIIGDLENSIQEIKSFLDE